MWYLYGLVLLAGISNAVQPGQNATLAKALPQPLTAGLVVAGGTIVSVLIVGLVTGRLAWPSYEQRYRIAISNANRLLRVRDAIDPVISIFRKE